MFEENMKKTKKTLVKICGLRRPEDAMAANCLKPDLAGFILSPGFRRSIDPEQAQRLRRILTPDIRTVGVFVDAPLEEILQAAEGGWIDMIQLHGREDRDYITKLTDLTSGFMKKGILKRRPRAVRNGSCSTAEQEPENVSTGTFWRAFCRKRQRIPFFQAVIPGFWQEACPRKMSMPPLNAFIPQPWTSAAR